MTLCVCVYAYVWVLGLSPERFCSVPHQGDASYHGSNISSASPSLSSHPCVSLSFFFFFTSHFTFFILFLISLSLSSSSYYGGGQDTSHHFRDPVVVHPRPPLISDTQNGNYGNTTCRHLLFLFFLPNFPHQYKSGCWRPHLTSLLQSCFGSDGDGSISMQRHASFKGLVSFPASSLILPSQKFRPVSAEARQWFANPPHWFLSSLVHPSSLFHSVWTM